MGDFTKAGTDRGDLEKEVENLLISCKMILRMYTATVEDLTKEELENDLAEYKLQWEKHILPLVDRAKRTKRKDVVKMAEELQETFQKLLTLIEEKLHS
ncbi:hypothetical protein Thal_0835 [Thermocrinis albus DSM 14484]|uniref:Uncharacterized protein n=1 Tax=Thermocrinis albus (strain DSM 14484 / JCM 11386 / HI 11/12) TaxID=638303 RepID=D3SL38_THEAH|nr:hypothetical protein [Thermocrinis albus]ADC89468.1 hypothetical protein Thal_0835 [Thermocrinis albus DSM 14484]